MKETFFMIHIGSYSDQASTIEIEKQHIYEDFDACFDVFKQLVFEHTALEIKQPRKAQPMSIEHEDDYFQIWELNLPQKNQD